MDIQSAAKLPFNLKIIATDENGIPALGIPFIAMFNPDSFTIHEDVEWNSKTAIAKQGSDPKYVKIKPRSFTIEFMLDGTGVNTNGVKIPVTAQVALFRAATTNVRGNIHRPPYLMVQYGTFINTCILVSSDVTYTMFDMFGLPIRAKISASFTERVIAGLSDVLGMLSSPDLTHRVHVKDGDLLPLLTYKTYKNQHYYLQVARFNKEKNFRKLEPGRELMFPPISKT
jgi:Contractile injection system tube protein